MSGKESRENFERQTGGDNQAPPESLQFHKIMEAPAAKAGDSVAAKSGVDAYMSDPAFQKDLASLRQTLSPELQQSMAAAVKVPSEQKAQGGDDPAEQAARIAAKQQEHIDNYAKAVAQKPQNEQVAEALKLAQYIEKMTALLNKVQGA